MVQTLPSSPKPDDAPEMSSEIRLSVAEFSGYSQRVALGVNNVRRSLTLKWTNITEYEASILEQFCEDHSAGQMFYWTPSNMSQLKWSLLRYRRTVRGAGFANFSMDIRQEFDPS